MQHLRPRLVGPVRNGPGTSVGRLESGEMDTANRLRIEELATLGLKLGTVAKDLPPGACSILAGPLNMMPGLLYSVAKFLLYDPNAKMKDTDAWRCFDALRVNLESFGKPGTGELSIVNTGNIQRDWLANVYINSALTRCAIIYERSISTQVFARAVSLSPASKIQAKSNSEKEYIRAMTLFHQKPSYRFSDLVKAINKLRVGRLTMKKWYRSLGGSKSDSQMQVCEDIYREVNRVKHWVGRQLSALEDPGQQRTLGLQEVLSACDIFVRTDGLLWELYGVVSNWRDPRALNYQ